MIVHELATHMRLEIYKHAEVLFLSLKHLAEDSKQYGPVVKAREEKYDNLCTRLRGRFTDALRLFNDAGDTEKVGDLIKTYTEVLKKITSIQEGRRTVHVVNGRAAFLVGLEMEAARSGFFNVLIVESIYEFIEQAHAFLQDYFPNRMRLYTNTYEVMPGEGQVTACSIPRKIEYMRHDIYHCIRLDDARAFVTCVAFPIVVDVKWFVEQNDVYPRFYLALGVKTRSVTTFIETCVLDLTVCMLDENGNVDELCEEAGFNIVFTELIHKAVLPINLGHLKFDASRCAIHFRVAKCRFK